MAALLALDADALAELVTRNVAIKAAVVMADEKETGVRATLNFGHTFAHAIEAVSGYGVILHGEAVALGMLAASTLAASIGLCSAGLRDELEALVAAAGLAVRARLPDDERLLEAMALDKKVVHARIRFVLPTRLGAVELRDDLEPAAIRAAWASIRN